MINRTSITAMEVHKLDEKASTSKTRRARNRAAGLCINENLSGTHGPATHGVRCARCHATHRGTDTSAKRAERLRY